MKQQAKSTEDRCVIGLDVGGTKVAGGVVSFPYGTILQRQTIPTFPERGGAAVIDDVFELATSLSNQASMQGRQVHGIGLGVCELVDLDGNVTSRQTLDWPGLPIQERFRSIAPTLVESDVRAAALAEALFGAGKPFGLFAYVTVGTGISHTLVQHGRAFSGARGNAIILASGALTMHCPVCGVRSDFVLEEFASGQALVARFNKQSARPVVRGNQIFEAADQGDLVAINVLATGGEALGNMVGFLVNVLDPEAIVIGGGLGMAGGIYWQNLESSARKHIWNEGTRGLPILPAALGVDAGLIGAAAAMWERLNNPQGRTARK
jgi:glucokinase